MESIKFGNQQEKDSMGDDSNNYMIIANASVIDSKR